MSRNHQFIPKSELGKGNYIISVRLGGRVVSLNEAAKAACAGESLWNKLVNMTVRFRLKLVQSIFILFQSIQYNAYNSVMRKEDIHNIAHLDENSEPDPNPIKTIRELNRKLAWMRFWDAIPAKGRALLRFIKRIFIHHYYLKVDGLKSQQWYDKDYVLLFSMFQNLKDYVEKETPWDHINWEYTEEQSEAAKEIKALYHWWTITYPNRKDLLDNLPPKEEGETFRKPSPALKEVYKRQSELDDAYDLEDTEMMIRLVKVRHYLWT